jgi:hypothetical protein
MSRVPSRRPVATTCLVHLWVALLVLVLSRTGGTDDRGIHDRAVADLDPILLQVLVDRLSAASAPAVPAAGHLPRRRPSGRSARWPRPVPSRV